MNLNPTEEDRLRVFTAAMARRDLQRRPLAAAPRVRVHVRGLAGADARRLGLVALVLRRTGQSGEEVAKTFAGT